MKTLNEIYGKTETQIKTIASNMVITCYSNEQVTKVTKIDIQETSLWGDKITDENRDCFKEVFVVTIVNVRTMNNFKKAKTRKVRIYTHYEGETKVSIDWTKMTLDEALNLEVVNPNFDNLTKEQGQRNFELDQIAKAEAKAEELREKQITAIVDEINYNIADWVVAKGSNRSPKQLKTSFKKYTSEVMEDAKISLDEKGVELLEKVQFELKQPKGANNPASLLATVTNCNVLKVCKELEETFEEEAEKYYHDCLSWLIKEETKREEEAEKGEFRFFPTPLSSLKAKAEYMVASNKYKLFGCVIRNLGQYPIANVERTFFRNNIQGFEGEWSLMMEDGTMKTFDARSIIAEGFHVCRHFRYIGTVRK